MRRFVYLHKGAVVGHVAIGKVTDDQYADRFVTPEYSGPLATIERLLVHPSLRSRGLGSLLFDTALEYIVSLGARPVLDVFSSQSDAIRLYEARGFVQCAELLWRARAEYGVDEPKTVLAMVGPTPARTPQSEAADTG
jgi:GNAT superfamily N-acetyltransferase